MPSVLGKRTRSIDSPVPKSKRVSRQVQVLSDENVSPEEPASVTRTTTRGLAGFTISTPSKNPVAATGRPAKHGKGINTHFRVSKSNAENDTPVKKTVTTESPLTITPKHRDTASKVNPITPQNRVLVPGGVFTPRTPSTPTNISKPNPYAQARQLFTGGSEETLLVGREQERAQVADFISGHLSASTGGCLYVSGPPGTGKSAFISDIVDRLDISSHVNHAMVNCMSIKNAAELAETLTTALQLDLLGKKKADALVLKEYFSGSTDGPVSLLILDEIDRLVELDLKLLYSLFEWSSLPASKLILVGIANALDLTDRLLPRLKSRNVKPSLLPFMPYSAVQINDIITAKLRSLNTSATDPTFVPFLHPAAILLCSKKIASQTGDLRKAFDIVKRALTLAESEARKSSSISPAKTPLSENINLSSPPIVSLTQTKLTCSLAHLTVENAPRATIAHVAKVTSQIFSNGMSSRLAQLNIQQKAVLCTLSSLEKRARSALSNALSSMVQYVPATPSKTGKGQSTSPSTKKLYDAYAELCRRENLLHPLSSVEFRDVLSGLETLSLIEFVDGSGKGTLGLMTPTKTPSRKGKKADFGQMGLGPVGCDDRKVAGVVGFAELKESLTGPGCEILREILEG